MRNRLVGPAVTEDGLYGGRRYVVRRWVAEAGKKERNGDVMSRSPITKSHRNRQ